MCHTCLASHQPACTGGPGRSQGNSVYAPACLQEKSIAAKAKDGFALLALDRQGHDKKLWDTLEQLLETNSAHLGYGADHKGYPRYNRIRMARAWRLEHPTLWDRYTGAQQQVVRDMSVLHRAHKTPNPGLPPKTASAAGKLPGGIRTDVNETILMTGTPPKNLLSILSTGPNERFSGSNAGTAYGDGTYLAEDAGKNDQYVDVDAAYDSNSELHKRLYGHGVQHPGKVFYLLVCRVSLGHHVRTSQHGRSATSMDGGFPIFPISFRELAAVPGVSPPVHFHSLLADVMPLARYREFIVFHSELIYPEYVIAYHRFNGSNGPV